MYILAFLIIYILINLFFIILREMKLEFHTVILKIYDNSSGN